MALILRRRGIERVRPLAGGFRAWRDLGYPLTDLAALAGAEPLKTPTPEPAQG